MNNHKVKLKWENIILTIFFIVFLVIFIISLINIIKWIIDSNDSSKQINSIVNNIKIDEVNDSDKTEIIPNEDDINEFNPYWDYIKMPLINVNFEDLKNENSDTVGWIKVNGTNINYPFVQTDNNDFYLTHSFNKQRNNAGWVFLDYRNNKENFDKNTIIYAHGRANNIMFGTLRNILKSDWIKETDNYIIKLSTEKENTLWQVFSIYRIPTTNDYLKISFNDNKDFLEFAKMLVNRSDYNFNTNVYEGDKILTLSTCYNDKDKVVLHAKLIKREKR